MPLVIGKVQWMAFFVFIFSKLVLCVCILNCVTCAFQGRPDLISGVRIDVMTEEANEKSNQGTPCWLAAELLSLVGILNLLDPYYAVI